MPPEKALLIVATIATLAFFTNLVWENIHITLYEGYPTFQARFIRCLPATGGDVIIILSIYALLTLMHNDWLWLKKINRTDTMIALLAGLCIALAIEYVALATGRWHYKPSMPLLPGTSFGLLPIIQMLILPLLIFYLTQKIVFFSQKKTPLVSQAGSK